MHAGDRSAGGEVPAPVPALEDFAHESVRGILELGGGRWRSLDDDPQFLLTLARGESSHGVYCFIVRLHGDAVHAPCLYLDFGAGWSQSTCFPLHEESGGGQWSTTLVLPAFGARVRLDPTDRVGEFHFLGAVVERRGDVDGDAGLLADDRVESADLHRGASQASTLPSQRDYARWIARHDTLPTERRLQLARTVAALPRRPLFSLVMAIGSVAEDVEALLQSLRAQILPDWELWLVHAHGVGIDALAALDAHARSSSRVQLVSAPSNAGEGLLAAGVARARGAWVAVLDQPVQLAPQALLAFADALARSPGSRLAYADEDRIDAAGRRDDPYFKSAWDRDLLLTHDQLGPLVVWDAALLREVIATMGADCDDRHARRLQLTSLLTGTEVVHVPHVLYHVPADAADVDGDAMSCALARHLGTAAPGSRVEEVRGALRVVRTLRDPLPRVSIIIPTRDRVDLLRRCVDSILALTTYPHFEIVIVDNQSSDPGTLAYFGSVQSDARVRVLAYDQPFNYSAVNNHAVERVDGDVIALLNNDVEVITPGWLEEMLQYAVRPDVGAVGAMLYYPDDTIQHAGVVVGLGGVAGHAYLHQPRGHAGQRGRCRHVQRFGAVTAACLLVRRDAYRQVGGLDESLAIAFNDVDFCLRLLKIGLRNVWTPFAELYHHESASRGVEDTPEKQARFAAEVQLMLTRWGMDLERDTAYHPNLSLAFNRAFALADPPRAGLERWLATVVPRSPAA